MNQRRDVTLPALLLASMTVYGFLLVWAQNDTIELTTVIGDQEIPMSPAGFNIVTGGNVSIELSPWHSTSMVPAVTTPAPDSTVKMDSMPTAATSLNSATIPPPTTATKESKAGTTTSGARVSSAMTEAHVSPAVTHMSGTSPGNASIIPRAIKRSTATTNSKGRVSIRVKIQSGAPEGKATELFLQKACEFFQTLQLEDVTVTLGPERALMQCLASVNN